MGGGVELGVSHSAASKETKVGTKTILWAYLAAISQLRMEAVSFSVSSRKIKEQFVAVGKEEFQSLMPKHISAPVNLRKPGKTPAAVSRVGTCSIRAIDRLFCHNTKFVPNLMKV